MIFFKNVSYLKITFVSKLCKMANEVYGILFSNIHPVSGATYQSAARDEESFLTEVISPIYQVLLKVTTIALPALVFATYIQVLV